MGRGEGKSQEREFPAQNNAWLVLRLQPHLQGLARFLIKYSFNHSLPNNKKNFLLLFAVSIRQRRDFIDEMKIQKYNIHQKKQGKSYKKLKITCVKSFSSCNHISVQCI
ncbi:hypothetical protein ACSBR2_014042 [Camellia fascicularis]